MKIGPLDLGDFPLFLAPMEDVTDPPYRVLCRRYGADMVFSEFISTEGLIRGAEKSAKKLDIFPGERPVGIQIFGHDLDSMLRAVKIVEKAGPEVIDINYGCPVKKVVNKGAGAAFLKDPVRMEKFTRAIVQATDLPVTVKTRIGWDENSINIEEVALRMQDAGVKAIFIHGRTRAQMYGGKADWEAIARVKRHPDMEIPVVANGDIDTPEKAALIRDRYGMDGAMIGRGAIGSPWIFSRMRHYLRTGELLPEPPLEEKVEALKTYLRDAARWKGERLAVLEARRHYGPFFKGLPGIRSFRNQLVRAATLDEVFAILDRILKTYAHDPA
ncbi:MAG: tRNA dihydrouridine synthase DusB [Chlorobi bacterium]|nr:tRNA dihydrouridine synthase DusB [Chlorobiota bacterium]